jgi:mediator of RNA polymerase II transcription subunit 14
MAGDDELPRHTRTVRLGELVERVVASAYNELQALASNLPGQPEADRKRELARYLHNLRQRLVRLAVLAEWAPTQRVRPASACDPPRDTHKRIHAARTPTAGYTRSTPFVTLSVASQPSPPKVKKMKKDESGDTRQPSPFFSSPLSPSPPSSSTTSPRRRLQRAQISVLCGDMLGQLRQHERAFTDSADRLFGLHSQMEWARAPLYDLPGALDVLCNGKYSCLPATIADVAPIPLPPGVAAAAGPGMGAAGGFAAAGAGGGDAQDGGGGVGGGGGVSGGDAAAAEEDAKAIAEREDRARRVEREIRGRLLEVEAGVTWGGSRPAAMQVWEITNGTAVVGVPGEYRAMLTLGGPPPLPPPPPPLAEGEDPVPPPPAPPPPPYGGWFVERIEMLAGERSEMPAGAAGAAGAAAAVARRFPLTKLEHRVLGERATARMAGMSPPPPAPPELIEGGAQGLGGLHYVCHDAALRLAAAAVMAQSKRLARGGVPVRMEPIKGGAAAAAAAAAETAAEAGGDEGGSAGVGATRKGGGGEGVRVWFWLPGGGVGLGAAGTRLAGVDVGSVEAVKASAAAIDAAVAAGTLPRVELTYVRADEKDSSSGSIQAAALIPHDDDGGGTEGGGSVEVNFVPLTFDTAAVDVREVLADGIRAASRARLTRVLAEITAPCQALGLAPPSLEPAAVNPGLAAAASEARAGWGGAGAGAGAEEDGSGGGDGLEGAGEDGWGASPRPSIVVRLTSLGTAVEVTCGKRDGDLSLCGVGALLPSAAAAALENAVRGGGASYLPKALASLRRAAVEHDLRAAVRHLGHHPHPAPHTLRCDQGWPFGGAPPAVLLPVAPTAGGCYVAAFVAGGESEQENGGGGAGGGSGEGIRFKASLALLHTRRANAATRAEVLSWAPLTATGGVLGTKKRKSAGGGENGVTEVLVAERLAAGMVAAVEAEAVTAQRLAVTGWLTKRGLRFQDVRPVRGGGGGGAGGAPPHPAITFSARLWEGEWSVEETAAVEIHLRGKDGIYAEVRSSWAPPQANGGEAAAAAAAAGTSAAVAGCGGAASITFAGGGGCTIALDYPGATVVGGVEFSPGAVCADVHRAVASLAFLRGLNPALESGALRVVASEPLSVLLGVGLGGGVGGGEGGGGAIVRVAWVGAAGPEGGLAAAGVEVPGVTPITAQQEAAASEAARIFDVDAFCDPFK